MFVIKKIVFLCVLLLFICGLVVYILWANTALQINEYAIYSDRIPKKFDGFRIAQVSDLHNTEIGKDNITVLQNLQESKPDIIVITGDLIDSRRTNIDIALKFAENAMKIAPVYYVPGNHEGRVSEYENLKSGLEDLNVFVLENTSISLESNGQHICLSGVYDPRFYTDYLFGEPDQVMGMKLTDLDLDSAEYNILLSHRPELFSVYTNYEIDLVLSGHAHGGQIRLPWVGGLWAPNQGFFPAYDSGLYTQGNTNMLVSRGVGNSAFPVRVFNRPEIVLVKLHSQ